MGPKQARQPAGNYFEGIGYESIHSSSQQVASLALFVSLHPVALFGVNTDPVVLRGPTAWKLVVQTLIFQLSGFLKPLHLWPGFLSAFNPHLFHPSAHVLYELIPAFLIYHAFGRAPAHQIALCRQQQHFSGCLRKSPETSHGIHEISQHWSLDVPTIVKNMSCQSCQDSGDCLSSSSCGSCWHCHVPRPPSLPCVESRSQDKTLCQTPTKLPPAVQGVGGNEWTKKHKK